MSSKPFPPASPAVPAADAVAGVGHGAFEAVVKTWSRLVFSTALRRLGGDAAAAQEVTQNVFLTAFRKFEILARAESPAAWFHRAAMLESSNFLRMERRRRRRLETFSERESAVGTEPPEPIPESARAHLDEALDGLRDHDRELVLGRFFEGRSFQDLAESRRSTPDAVRVRLSRVLEKLAALLRRRGVAVTAVSLGAALATQWTQAAAGTAATLTTAALQSGHTASPLSFKAFSPGRIPQLLTIMTYGKTTGALALALLLMLLALRSQSARLDDLHIRIDRGGASAPADTRAEDSRAAAAAKWKQLASSGRPGPVATAAEDTVTGASLLAAVRKADGISYSPEEGKFETTRLDEKLSGLTAKELLRLLDEVASAPGGAGLKSRARFLIIARWMAKADPKEALRQAARYRLSDETFFNVARGWCRRTDGESPQTLTELLERPGALPAGKFGSDPAAAVRRGIAAGVGARDLAAGMELCRAAAGTSAAGDYLEGLTYLLGKGDHRETLFDLLKGVSGTDQRIAALAGMAANLETYRAPYPIHTWFDDPAFPAELRNQAVMKAARDIQAPGSLLVERPHKPLRMIAEGSAPEDRLGNTLEWLQSNQPPKGENRSWGDGREEAEKKEDDITETALRLAATADLSLAMRWMPAIQNPERRETVARSLGVTKP